MSKIGRKPIDVSKITVDVQGQAVHYKGAKGSGVYELPQFFEVSVNDNKLTLNVPEAKLGRRENEVWGMHRALLANAIKGVGEGFEKQLKIIGLGYKATISGSKVILTLGFSHKIEVQLPKDVALEIDKSGQVLTFKSSDKESLGKICDNVRSLRPPEPYKGTGVRYMNEEVARKAGKTKGA